MDKRRKTAVPNTAVRIKENKTDKVIRVCIMVFKCDLLADKKLKLVHTKQ